MSQENSNSTIHNLTQQTKQAELSLSDIWDFIWRLKWWILGSAIVALIIAFFYLHLQTPIYTRSTWAKLNKNDGSVAELSILDDVIGGQKTSKELKTNYSYSRVLR